MRATARLLGISRVTVSSYVHANGVPRRRNGGRPRPPRRAPRYGSGSLAGVAEAPHRADHGDVVGDGITVAGGEIRLPDHSGWSSCLPGPPCRGRRRPGHPRDTPVSLAEGQGPAAGMPRGAGRRARARPESGAALSGPAAIVDGDLPALAGCRDVPALADEMVAGPRRIHHSMRRPRCQGGGGGADDPHQNAAVRRRCGGGWARRLRRPGSYSAAVPVPSPSVIFQITPRSVSDTSSSPSAVKMIPSGLVNPRSATIDTSPPRVTLMTRS